MSHSPSQTNLSTSLPFSPDKPWLAPLAGYTDLSFRLLCREHGASVACTEMVSAKGLVYGLQSKKKDVSGTEALLATTKEDSPLVVQLFGNEIPFLEKAMDELLQRGFSWFDLNMGCSVPKVNKTGAGSAMMKDIPTALKAAKSMIDRAKPGSVGFKFRLGWSYPDSVYLDLAKGLEQQGAGWVTLHPRYARQGFSGTADWACLETLVRSVSIPVIASGDLLTAEDAVQCVQQTGVASVMFARGAIVNPAVFSLYRKQLAKTAQGTLNTKQTQMPASVETSYESPQCNMPSIGAEHLSSKELHRLIVRHAELSKKWCAGKPDKRGIEPALVAMRIAAPRYVRHLPGVKALRHSLSGCSSWDEFDVVVSDFFCEGKKFEEKE